MMDINTKRFKQLPSWLLALTLILTGAFGFGCVSSSGVDEAEAPLRVMTFNIRFHNAKDGDNAWPHRRAEVARLIVESDTQIAALQEALADQVADLEADLPGYARIGIGRDDGEAAGEFSPIFYRADRLALLDHGTFWLSDTPDVVASVGWDAAITRICTWGQFEDLQTRQTLFVFNTHFDHQGKQARLNSAALLAERIPRQVGEAATVLVGDFNFRPSHPAYATLAETFRPAVEISETPPTGPTGTFPGFRVKKDDRSPQIDHAFALGPLRVITHATLDATFNSNKRPSDHRPITFQVIQPTRKLAPAE